MNIIIAPSAAGKSTYIKTHPGQRLVDLDHEPAIALLYKELGERYGKIWWTNGDHRQLKDLRVLQWYRDTVHRPWTLGKTYFTAEKALARYSAAFVIPAPDTLMAQSLARDNGYQPTYRTIEQATEAVVAYANLAHSVNKPVFTSFEQAVPIVLHVCQ
jgi:hypothetical protein